MRIGVIGAGRAGGGLGLALHNAGHQLTAVHDLHPERAEALAGETGAQNLTPAAVAAAADVIIIGVPDDDIAPTAAALAPTLGDLRGKVFFHLSGALPASSLLPLAAHGALGSLHPLLSMAEIHSAATGLGHCFFAVEGDPEAVAVGRALVGGLSGRLLTLRTEDKALYHAGAFMAANCLLALLDLVLGIYERFGMDRAAAIEAIHPLVQGTLTNLRTMGAEKALTGPIVRGDTATVAGHLQALAAGDSLTMEAYKQLGRATARLALRAGRLAPDKAEAFEEMLGGGRHG